MLLKNYPRVVRNNDTEERLLTIKTLKPFLRHSNITRRNRTLCQWTKRAFVLEILNTLDRWEKKEKKSTGKSKGNDNIKIYYDEDSAIYNNFSIWTEAFN